MFVARFNKKNRGGGGGVGGGFSFKALICVFLFAIFEPKDTKST